MRDRDIHKNSRTMRNVMHNALKTDAIATRYLIIGEGEIFEKPTRVHTVLGSCVAVTFYCPRKKIGALFHALLPQKDQHRKQVTANPFVCVDSAITYICRALFRRGIKREHIEAKIFGGAQVLLPGEISVGANNSTVARETLNRYNIRVVDSHIGGRQSRKIIFLSHTGDVSLKLLPSNRDSND